MASSIASHTYLEDSGLWEGHLGQTLIHQPKQTAIDKIGGIFCHLCNVIARNKKEFDSHYSQHIIGGGYIVYTCLVCKKQFQGYPSFRDHCYLRHVVKDKYQCQHCSKCFSKQSILTGHISAVHDYRCSLCDEQFTTKKELESHKFFHTKKANDEPPYDCLNCNKSLNSVDTCETHIDDHCEIHYPCSMCDELFKNKPDAIQHLAKHYDDAAPSDIEPTTSTNEDSSINILGGILCCHCDVLFKNRMEFDDHFVLDHEDKPIVYTCNICGKHYEKYHMFGNHCYFHITKDKFQCDQCHNTFPRLSLLVSHTDAFHCDGALDKPYRCDQCGHSFKARYRLYQHMRTVHNEICIKCPLSGCNTSFESPKELSSHLRQHKCMLERWCRACGLQLSTAAAGARHVDVHRRKQYWCPVCGRTYRERYLAARHAALHFHTTLHLCKVCGKGYAARNRLVQHLKTHAERRPYRCPECPKTFVNSSQLTQHVNVHSAQRPYECTSCPKTFANYSNWRKHLIRIHEVDKEDLKAIRLAREQKIIASARRERPVQVESGIESASSELSTDVYSLPDADAESDDSLMATPTTQTTQQDAPGMYEMNTISDPLTGRVISITDAVNAVIDRIDAMENDLDQSGNELRDIKNEHFVVDGTADDSSDIKAIVEHIDAMSGDIERRHDDAPVDNITAHDATVIGEFTHITELTSDYMQVEPAVLTPVSTQYILSPPEYGPDFNIGTEFESLIDVDDHHLPHIDPMLTIKEVNENIPQTNFTYQITNTMEYQNWEPLITKVFSNYDESNDSKMYMVDSNIF